MLDGKVQRTFLGILAPVIQLPPELERLFIVVEHDQPTREELHQLLKSIATEAGELPTKQALNAVMDATAGLTRYEAENAFSLSLVRHNHVRAEPNELTESVSLAPEILDQICQGDGEIQFSAIESTENGSRFTLSWHHGIVERRIEIDHTTPEPISNSECKTAPVERRFLECLHNTANITDESSQRYALYCIQLDGTNGSVTSTDGAQLLRFGGFAFPWPEQSLLIRSNKLFMLAEFAKLNEVNVGVEGDTFLLHAGSWKFAMPIERDCRFPNIENVIPPESAASNRVQLHPKDCHVLANCVKLLPGDREFNKPVSIDLNGHVAIVGQSAPRTTAGAAIILERSIHIGPNLRTAVDRDKLHRAIKLGATELFFCSNRPILARGSGMQFVLASLLGINQEFEISQMQQIRSTNTKIA